MDCAATSPWMRPAIDVEFIRARHALLEPSGVSKRMITAAHRLKMHDWDSFESHKASSPSHGVIERTVAHGAQARRQRRSGSGTALETSAVGDDADRLMSAFGDLATTGPVYTKRGAATCCILTPSIKMKEIHSNGSSNATKLTNLKGLPILIASTRTKVDERRQWLEIITGPRSKLRCIEILFMS